MRCGITCAWQRRDDDVSLRFIQPEDPDATRARMALIVAMSKVIASGLEVLGVEPVKEMH